MRTTADVLGCCRGSAARSPKCQLCPWNLPGSRALNYPLQQLSYCWFTAYCHLLHKKCSRWTWPGRYWVVADQTGTSDSYMPTHLTSSSVSVLLQSFLSGCGCAGEAWRFFPAAAWVMCSGSDTRTTSQKATLSPTLSEWVDVLETWHPCLLYRVITPQNNLPTAKKVNLLLVSLEMWSVTWFSTVQREVKRLSGQTSHFSHVLTVRDE